MRKIEDLKKTLETLEEWQAYCETQLKQISSLLKKTQDLENEKRNLEKLLSEERAKKAENELGIQQTNLLLKEDVEIIAEIQIKKLKEVSFERELTLDEAKRCEIYNKILLSRVQKEDDVKVESRTLSNEELISALSGPILLESK